MDKSFPKYYKIFCQNFTKPINVVYLSSEIAIPSVAINRNALLARIHKDQHKTILFCGLKYVI